MTTRIQCLLPGLDSHILLENSLEILLVRYSGPRGQSLLIHPWAFSQRYMNVSRGQWTPFDSTRPNSESKTLKGSILPLYLGHIPMTQEKDCNTLLVLRENQVRITRYKGHRCRYLECNWDQRFRLGICKCPVSCPVPSTWTLGDTLHQHSFESLSQNSSKPRVFGLFSRLKGSSLPSWPGMLCCFPQWTSIISNNLLSAAKGRWQTRLESSPFFLAWFSLSTGFLLITSSILVCRRNLKSLRDSDRLLALAMSNPMLARICSSPD